MDAIIVLLIFAAIITTVISALTAKSRKNAGKPAQTVNTDSAQTALAQTVTAHAAPAREGGQAVYRQPQPEKKQVQPPESEPEAGSPGGLFADADECVRAVIYSEIMRPKFRRR